MNQRERRQFLIQSLLRERPQYRKMEIPADEDEQRQLLRGLMNVRAPQRIGADFLQVQDDYLQDETAAKGMTDLADLTPVQPGLYLWQGDITTLKCDAIVNAANSGMTGLLRSEPSLHRQRHPHLRGRGAAPCLCGADGTGRAIRNPPDRQKSLRRSTCPASYVLHTVGPIISGRVTEKADKEPAGILLPLLLGAGGGERAWKAWRSAASPRENFAFPTSWRQKSPCRRSRNF